MAHAFPYRSEPQETGGGLMQFLDVGRHTPSVSTEGDAGGDHALDCLIAALGGYIKLGRETPVRARPGAGRSSSCRSWSRPSSRFTRRCGRSASPGASSHAGSA